MTPFLLPLEGGGRERVGVMIFPHTPLQRGAVNPTWTYIRRSAGDTARGQMAPAPFMFLNPYSLESVMRLRAGSPRA